MRRYRFLLAILSFIFLLPLLTGCWGDPGTFLKIDNQTDQTLVIFIDNLHDADVQPEELKEFPTTNILPENIYPDDKKFLIEAKTKQGEVIYSENFTWQELDDMDWTIVIPPLKK
jgi:hypothetical protein